MTRAEPLAIYRDRFPGTRRSFTLYPDRIIVRTRERFAGESEYPFLLRDLEPDYAMHRGRSEIAGPGALILAGIFGFLFVFGLINGTKPGFHPIGTGFNFALAVACLITGCRNLPKIERYLFRLKGGTVAFDVARSGEQRDQFDSFIQQLVAAIQSIQSANEPTTP